MLKAEKWDEIQALSVTVTPVRVTVTLHSGYSDLSGLGVDSIDQSKFPLRFQLSFASTTGMSHSTSKTQVKTQVKSQLKFQLVI